MTYLPDKHLLVAAQNQEGLHIISTEMRQAVGSLALGNASIYDVLALDNGFVAVADGEGWVKIIDPVELKVVAQAQVSAQSVRVLCQISHDTLAAGGSDGCIRLLDMQTLQASQVWQANAPTVMTLCALPNGRLASGGRDARIKTWDLTSYTEGAPTLLHDVPAHHYSVYSLALHPGGELLLSSSMDKTLKIWDANTLSLLRVVDKERYKGHSASVNRCMWLSEKQALSASDDRTAVLWDLAYPEA
jgi:WD40 repeat protein